MHADMYLVQLHPSKHTLERMVRCSTLSCGLVFLKCAFISFSRHSSSLSLGTVMLLSSTGSVLQRGVGFIKVKFLYVKCSKSAYNECAAQMAAWHRMQPHASSTPPVASLQALWRCKQATTPPLVHHSHAPWNVHVFESDAVPHDCLLACLGALAALVGSAISHKATAAS